MNINLTAFPKIFSIGENSIKHLFDDDVEITEKVDGSQFVFYKTVNDRIEMRSKGRQIFIENIDKLFKPVATYIHDNKDKIPANHIFYGETLAKPQHNTLKYDRVPKNHLVLFAVEKKVDAFGSIFLDYSDIELLATSLDVDMVPLFFKGKMPNYQELLPDFLNKKSYLGNVNIEGIVIKNIYKNCAIGDKIFPITCAKFVSANFKEVHDKSWKSKNVTNKDALTLLKERYKSFSRWEKSIQHLKEMGELTNSPQDIGKLIVEINKDIEEECKESIKEDLYQIFGKEIIRYACSGFPEWYKQKLFDESK